MTDDRRDDDATDEPSAADVERVTAALRASAPVAGEPDWTQLAADIGAAVDGEVRRQRRVRVWAIGGAVLAAAAVAALLVWPIARGKGPVAKRVPGELQQMLERTDAADGADVRRAKLAAANAAITEDVATLGDDAIELPDDLGGITLDEELIGEAAAALDGDMAEEEDALDERLLPDGAWIDELSDDELERVVEILDEEPG